MTTKADLHRLVDELPEARTELARLILEDLNGADDENGEPPTAEELASFDRGLADIREGRVKSVF